MSEQPEKLVSPPGPPPGPVATATRVPAPSCDGWIFLAIAALAFVLRAMHLFQASSVPFFYYLVGDAETYAAWAQRIAGGDWLGTGVFYQAPLYPYFLALVERLVGGDLTSVRVVQSALGALTCGFVFLTTKTLVSRPAGIAAGLLLALYPTAIFFDGLIQKPMLDLFLLSLMLWVLAGCRPTASPWRWLAAGVCLGLLCLTRENALLMVPVIIVWLLLHFRPRALATRLAWVAAFVGGLAVVLVPVGVRNRVVGGEFVLMTAQAGTNFYIGNNPRADGSYVPLRAGRGNTPFEQQDATELAEKAVGRKLTPSQVSDFWLGQGWDFMRAHPDVWMRLTLRKLAWTLNAYEIPDTENQYFYELACPLIRTLDVPLHFGVLAPLAAAGIVLTWSRRRTLWLLYALLVTMIAGVVVFYVFARYRYPLVAILAPFAGAGLVEAWTALRQRKFRELVLAGIALALVARYVNQPIDYPKERQIVTSYTNAGIALVQHGQLDAAAADLRRAIELEPGAFEAHFGLGEALLLAGRLDEALAELETARKLAPDVGYVEGMLGAALGAKDNWEEAYEHLRRAVDLGPDAPQTLVNLGKACQKLRRWGEAAEYLHRAATLAPQEGRVAVELAWLLATCPDPAWRDGASAARIAEAACPNASCDDPRALDVLAAAYAELGRFDDAVRAARQALELATRQGAKRLAQEIGPRLKLYEAGQPFRLGS